MSLCWTGPPSDQVEHAIACARGIPGLMSPNPELADSNDTIALLEYAHMIRSAAGDDVSHPQIRLAPAEYRPEWLWNLVAKLALHFWRWKYRKLDSARVREWIAQSIDERTTYSNGESAAIQHRKF